MVENNIFKFFMKTTVFKSAEKYTAPDITVIDIELSQNILQGSSGAELPPIGDGESAW